MPKLGAHQSIAGGLEKAFARNAQVGGEALQIFTANQRQWNTRPLSDGSIQAYQQRWSEAGRIPVASHASYLINLASGKEEGRRKSLMALTEEIKRCLLLGIPQLVLHPGSHGGDGLERGLQRVSQGLDDTLEQSGALESTFMILLETTAGQGTSLGARFEELAWIRAQSRYRDFLGVCLDTCHIFAAGYDIRGEDKYQQVMAAFDRKIGLAHLHLFHLNDSKNECGSRVDRHAHIGKGKIGLEGFAPLLNDSRFQLHPMTLETPKNDDLAEDRENLARLRALIHS